MTSLSDRIKKEKQIKADQHLWNTSDVYTSVPRTFLTVPQQLVLGLFAFLFTAAAFAVIGSFVGKYIEKEQQAVLGQSDELSAQSLFADVPLGTVLSANDDAQAYRMKINVPAELYAGMSVEGSSTFQGDLTVSGTLTASNFGSFLTGITAGNGIAIGSGLRPSITNTGVMSVGGKTGVVTLVAGENITIDGTTISSTAVAPSVNSFETIDVDGSSITAGAKDTLSFVSGTGITLNVSGSSITISSESSFETPITAIQGGTGFVSYTIGDMLYASSTTELAKLPAGGAGQVLVMSGGVPVWGSMTGDACTNCIVADPSASQTITPTADVTGFSVRGANAGTADIFTLKNFAGTATYFQMTSAGNMVLGNSNQNTIAFTGRINSNVEPSVGSQYDLGSSADRWRTVYGDTANFTNIVTDSMNLNGTTAQDFLINTDYIGDDGESASLTFERGSPATNAQLKWNASDVVGMSRVFSFNAPLFVNPDASIYSSGKAAFIVNQPFAEDIFTASASGVGKFVIKNDGNVGIGTTEPGEKVDILGGNIRFATDVAVNTTSHIYGTNYNGGAYGRPDIQLTSASNGNSIKLNATATNYVRVGSGVGGMSSYGGIDLKTNQGHLKFYTDAVNGTSIERMRITDLGLVGIGTTSPETKLHLGGSGNKLRISYDSSGYPGLYFGDIYHNGGQEGLVISSSTANNGINQAITFKTSTTSNGSDMSTKMVILPGGNVGVGTTSPNSSLEVIGSGNFRGSGLTPRPIVVTNTDVNKSLSIQVQSNGHQQIIADEDLQLTSSAGSITIGGGNWLTTTNYLNSPTIVQPTTNISNGIGQVSPAFSIIRTYNQTSTAPGTDLLINRTETGVGSGLQYLIDTQVGSVSKFNVTNTGQGYFAGNVGIGTTSPGQKLEVLGNIRSTGGIVQSVDTSGASGSVTDGYMFSMDPYGGGTGPRLRLGQVNTPAQYFEIGAYFGRNNFDSKGRDLQLFGTGISGIMIKATSGNVGIGTTNPAYKLDVLGSANFSSNVGIGGTSPLGSALNIGGTWSISNGGGGLQFTPTLNADYSNIGGFFVKPTVNLNAGSYYGVYSGTNNTTITNGGSAYGYYYSGVGPLTGTLTNEYGLYIGGVIKGTNNYAIYTNEGKIYFGDNVGIGTTSPQAKLDVSGIFRASGLPNSSFVFPTSGSGFEMRYGTDANALGQAATGGSGASIFQSYDRSGGTFQDLWVRGKNIVFSPNDGITLGMVINSSGNVGIGTTSPATLLDVAGTTWLRGVAGGTSGLYVNASGNVGVGTTNPIYPLQVLNWGVNTTGQIVPGAASGSVDVSTGTWRVNTLNTGNHNQTLTLQTMNASSNGVVSVRVQPWFNFGDTTGRATAFQINPTISQTSVDGNYTALDVNPTIAASAGTKNYLANFQVDNVSKVVITDTGLIGIGTTSPASKLHLGGTTNSIVGGLTFNSGTIGIYEAYGALVYQSGSNSVAIRSNSFEGNNGSTNFSIVMAANSSTTPIFIPNKADSNTGMGWASDDILSFVAGGANVMNVTAGKVGIGTTSPTQKLHVVSSFSGTNPLSSDRVGAFVNDGTTSSNSIFSVIAGNAGVSGIDFGDTNDQDAGGLYYYHSDNRMEFRTNGSTTARMTIDSTGKVGIGTTNPAYALDVNGYVNATGLCIAGDCLLQWATIGTLAGYLYGFDDAALTGGQSASRATSGTYTSQKGDISFFGPVQLSKVYWDIYKAGTYSLTITEFGTNEVLATVDNVVVGSDSSYNVEFTISPPILIDKQVEMKLVSNAAVQWWDNGSNNYDGFYSTSGITYNTTYFSQYSLPVEVTTVAGSLSNALAGFTEIGKQVVSGVSGSILFVDATGELAQDNANFFWDDANNRLGIGTTAPAYKLQVQVDASTEGHVAADGTWANTSDARLKTHVLTMANGLGTVLGLRPVTYNAISDPTGEHSGLRMGFIAQEVEQLLPTVVDTDPITGYKSISYTRFIPLLTSAIQDLHGTVSTMSAEIDRIENQTSIADAMVLPELLEKLTIQSSLTVEGDTKFQGSAFFASIVEFLGSVIFTSPVEFASSVLFKDRVLFADTDMAGIARIEKSTTQVTVEFSRPYTNPPFVTISLQISEASDSAFLTESVRAATADISTTGFTIVLSEPLPRDVYYTWHALSVEGQSGKVEKGTVAGESISVTPTPSIQISVTPFATPSPTIVVEEHTAPDSGTPTSSTSPTSTPSAAME